MATFESAEQFLALCNPGAATCLVLDLHLGGMSGTELLAQLAAGGSPPPTIVITAHDDATARRAAERHGAVAFLRKPFEDHELVEAVERAVASRA